MVVLPEFGTWFVDFIGNYNAVTFLLVGMTTDVRWF